MKLTYYGHSCFSVVIDGKNVLFDPFITPNELAKHIDVNTIAADYIFVSHAHFDHLSDAADIALRTGAKVVANWEIHSWFNKQGVANTHPLNPGGKWTFDTFTAKGVIAIHSSSFPDGSYGGSPGGFAFATNEGNFYYSGDTALTMDMQLIPKFAKMDFAVLPIGDALTMGADDAIEAAKWLGVTKVLGVHYDTFGYIKIDHENAIKKFSESGIQLHLVDIGGTIDI